MDVSPYGSLYPDLGGVDMEESDPLPPLQSTVKARAPPKRPPPPRSTSISGSTGVSPAMAPKIVSVCVCTCTCACAFVCVSYRPHREDPIHCCLVMPGQAAEEVRQPRKCIRQGC